MDKNEFLALVKTLSAQNAVSEEDLVSAFRQGKGEKAEILSRKLTAADLLYYIGGGVIFLGIVILVGQNWEFLNGLAKILITLGSAVGIYISGVLLSRQERFVGVGMAFFIVSALLFPLGAFVTFDQAGINTSGFGIQSLISAMLVAFYLGSYFVFKKNLFLLFSIFFGTWLFFAFTELLLGKALPYDVKFAEYRALITGICYMLFAYAFASTDKKSLSGVLNGFGVLGFLGAGMALQGWKPMSLHGILWEIFYPFLVLGVILLSTKMRSKAFLTFGSMFLIGFILKITSEYFANSFGWPIALVVAGFALIGVGYWVVWIRRKYFVPTLPQA